MSKPRLLIILNRLATGGPALNTICLAEELSNDFDILLVAGEPNKDEQPADYLLTQHKGFRFQKLTVLRRSVLPIVDWRAYRKLKATIREFNPHIVHTHGTKPGVLGRIAAKQCKVPVIVHTFHGHVFHSYFSRPVSGIIVKTEHWLARFSTALIAISDLLKNELVQTYGVAEAEKVKVVKLGIDTAKFQDHEGRKRRQFRSEFGLAPTTKAIGIVGRLVPIKQQRLFIDTAALLLQKKEQLPPMQFFIIGDGAEKKQLQQYIHEGGLTSQQTPVTSPATADFVFTSWRMDMDTVYAGLDIVLLTSLNEGTPISVMEAMAAGKPVVSTNVGGVSELITHGETGFLAQTAAELLAHTQLLLEQPTIAEQIGQAAEKKATSVFSYATERNELISLYKLLLSGQKRL